MLLVLEIILTVIAWRRGWKWRALLAPAIMLGVVFVAGFVSRAIGGPEQMPTVVEVLIDVALIGTLIIMVIRPRQVAQPAAPSQGAEYPE